MMTVNKTSTAHNPNPMTSEISIISVFEHQRLMAHDFVHFSDFAWLLAQELSVFTIKRQRGQWQLKVGHYIGIIILPSGITLEILPKPIAGARENKALQQDEVLMTRQWVQRMLTDLTRFSEVNNNKLPHTNNLGQLSPNLAPLSSQTPPLSQWLVTQFLQLLSDYQPSNCYQTQTHNQATLQGKLLIKEQLRRNGTQPHKFVCEVSKLGQDTISNRLIKSALLLLTPLLSTLTSDDSIISKPLLAKVRSAWRPISALSLQERRNIDVLYTTAKHQLSVQPLTRQQLQAARRLLDLAYWLLKMQHSDVPTGSSISQQSHFGNKSPLNPATPPLRLCLLINMNQAFEQWASQQIAAQFGQLDTHNRALYQTLYQPRDVWLSDKAGQACLSIQPDVLIYRLEVDGTRDSARHCSHVIDIKWKYLPNSRAISASDAYQLTSYAQAYQAEHAWLVYPVVDSERQPVALQPPVATDRSNRGTLWLMPFNVRTGILNSLPPTHELEAFKG